MTPFFSHKIQKVEEIAQITISVNGILLCWHVHVFICLQHSSQHNFVYEK